LLGFKNSFIRNSRKYFKDIFLCANMMRKEQDVELGVAEREWSEWIMDHYLPSEHPENSFIELYSCEIKTFSCV
jgi:hypothetical protein